MQIQYAVDGRDALGKLAPASAGPDRHRPDDARNQRLATGRGRAGELSTDPHYSDDFAGERGIAVQALQQGAASYVPKRLLMRYLWDTIEKVLRASVEDRGQARLLKCMLRTESIFHLQNDPELFEPLIRYLQEETIRLGVCTDADRVRVGVALEEVLANALYHGNLGTRLGGPQPARLSRACAAAARAARLPRAADRGRGTHHGNEAAFAIRDEGHGFDPSQLPDPTDPVNIEKASGRGIFLMRAFMDEVCYNDVGNAVVLVKRRATSNGEK